MKIYCSTCGTELKHYRKAAPGRGHIFDMVDPHNCEGYAVKEKGEKPTVIDILDSLKPLGSVQVVSNGKNERGRCAEPGDRRADKSNITSSAPDKLIRSLHNLPLGENDLE